MGLDMTIYREEQGRDELIEEQTKLSNSIIFKVDKIIKDNEKAIDIKIKDFIDKYSEYIRNKENSVQSIENGVHAIITGRNDVGHRKLQWQLFNYCSIFSFDINKRVQGNITFDLYTIFKEFKKEDYSEIINKYDALEDRVSDMKEEVAYWRKAHDLNNYILNDLVEDFEGDGNCLSHKLTKSMMVNILAFTKEHEIESDQVETILQDWDDKHNYTYMPWW